MADSWPVTGEPRATGVPLAAGVPRVETGLPSDATAVPESGVPEDGVPDSGVPDIEVPEAATEVRPVPFSWGVP